jgi:hypothetical protein
LDARIAIAALVGESCQKITGSSGLEAWREVQIDEPKRRNPAIVAVLCGEERG